MPHGPRRTPVSHAARRPDRLARHRAALRRARPELRPPPRRREHWPRSRRPQRPSTGTGSVDDHGVMVIFAGRRRGGAPQGEAIGRQGPSSPRSRASGDQRGPWLPGLPDIICAVASNATNDGPGRIHLAVPDGVSPEGQKMFSTLPSGSHPTFESTSSWPPDGDGPVLPK